MRKERMKFKAIHLITIIVSFFCVLFLFFFRDLSFFFVCSLDTNLFVIVAE
jgi:hypothetical protein